MTMANDEMPEPPRHCMEDMERRIADLAATAYFAPTTRSRDALLGENVPPDRIHVTGNTVVDALHHVAALPYDIATGPLAELPPHRRLVLVTAHRRESFGGPFRELCHAIRDLAATFAAEGVHFVYPVHLNPNVRAPVGEILAGLPNVHLVAPCDYVTMVQAMRRAALVLTDSGGIQEETTVLDVPCLTLRPNTERPITLTAGTNRLVTPEDLGPALERCSLTFVLSVG